MPRPIKNVSLAEDYLHDHFPGYPVFPNSLMIEGLAQTGRAAGLRAQPVHREGGAGQGAQGRFYCEALPGDTLTYTATIEYVRRKAPW